MTDMSSSSRGSFPYRGRGARGARGRSPEVINQHGKKQLIAADLSQDADYQAFLEFKRQQRGNTSKEEDSYAKIVGDEESESNNIGFSVNNHKEIIFLLEEKDLKYKNDPWILMQRYMDNLSLPARTYKFRNYYEQILLQSNSCEISHFTGTNKEIYNFSKMIIKRVISLEDWGISPLREKEITFSHMGKNATVKYNYWDYCDAFIKVLDYENDKHKHSWFIKVCSNVYQNDIPHWFINWFNCFGPTPDILPERIKSLFDKWVDCSPHLQKKEESQIFIEGIASCFFFIEFSIPWIWKWTPEVGYTDSKIPCLFRISHIKFWDKMMKIDPSTKELYGSETIKLIEKKMAEYELNKENMCTPSPFDYITRKMKMKGSLSKEQMIAAYLDEMQKNLISKLEEDDKSVKSDSSMAIDQDAQDPNEVCISDIFEAMKDTLMEKIRRERDESSSHSVHMAEK